jgi:hypothetical protein
MQGGMDADAFGGAMVDGDEDRHLAGCAPWIGQIERLAIDRGRVF